MATTQIIAIGFLTGMLAVPTPPGETDEIVVEVVGTAQLLEQEGKVTEARRLLRDALQKRPQSPTLWHALGESMLRDDPRVTRLCAWRILKPHPDNQKGFDLLSAAYARSRANGLTREAELEQRRLEVEDYAAVLRAHPKWPEALYRSASQRLALERLLPDSAAQEKRQQLDTSIAELQQAAAMLESSSRDVLRGGAQFQLGRAYKHRADTARRLRWDADVARDDDQAAIKHLKQAIEIDPNRVDAIGEIVLIHQGHRQDDKALQVIETYLPRVTHTGGKAKMLEMRAQALANVGRTDEAISVFQNAIEQDRHLTGSYLGLSRLFQASGNIEKARNVLLTSVATLPTFVDGHVRLGYLAMSTGEHDTAVAHFENVMRIKPRDAVVAGMHPSINLYRNRQYYLAAASLAWLYADHVGDLDRATAAVEAAKKFGPPDAHLMDTLGWIHVKKGEHEKAVRILVLVAGQRGKKFPSLHYHLAEAYFHLDRLVEAERELKTALAMDGPFAQRAAAEARLKQIKSQETK